MPGLDALVGTLKTPASIEREDFTVFAGTPTGSTQSITFSRSSDFHVAAVLEDFESGTGTVTVHGNDSDSNPVTQAFTFNGNERRVGFDQAFRSVTKVVTSGLDDESTVGTLTLEAVDQNGQPKEELTTIQNIKVRVNRARFGQIIQSSGNVPMDSAQILIFPNVSIRKADRIVADGERWEVKAIRKVYMSEGRLGYKAAIVFAEDQS